MINSLGISQFEIMPEVHKVALQEIFTHKNHFGSFMAPGGVIFLLNAFKKERFSWYIAIHSLVIVKQDKYAIAE